MQAIKCGGRFVVIFLTTEAFWRNLHDADDDGAQTFQGVTRDVQKATRVMQILCSEAKSRKDISLIAKVCFLKSLPARSWVTTSGRASPYSDYHMLHACCRFQW